MSLNILWFILIAVLFCGFFFLEGFDFGVGMLLPFIGGDDKSNGLLINSIGPVWQSNEVWLLTAGGAIFAAFPGWYATMFSGFYLALFLVLLALIIRGVAMEFRARSTDSKRRQLWDLGLSISSFLTPLLLGVAMANLINGVPIDANQEFVGGFFDLLSFTTLLAGITTGAVFIYHGAVYLTLKLEGPMLNKAYQAAHKAGLIAVILTTISAVTAGLASLLTKPLAIMLALLCLIALAASYSMILKQRSGWSLILNGISIASAVAALFTALFPRVMVSSINNDYSLTIYNVCSTPYTLKVMSMVALTVLPVVLGYLIWTYWVFRQRLSADANTSY